MYKKSPIALVLATLASTQAWSDDSAKEIEEILVWGTKVSASNLSFDEDAVAIRQVDHISDLLRTIPGVDVGGAHSMNQRITIRSMDDKDLRITIDGANQNTYMYHHMGNLQIHADILSEASVNLGVNSVIDGGLGGTVRFKTKSASDLLRGNRNIGFRVQGTYADNASEGLAASLYGNAGGGVDYLAYINAIQRDDFEVGGGEIKDENGDVIDGTDGKVRGIAGDLFDALLKVGYNINDDHRLKFGYETYTDKGDYSYRPDMGLATDIAINEGLGGPLLWPTEFTRDTFTVNYEAMFKDHTTFDAAIFTNESTLERDESGWVEVPAFAAWAGTIKGDATNIGGNAMAVTDLGAHTLTYGGEYILYDTEYSADYDDPEAADESATEEAANAAAYIEDRMELLNWLTVIPGLRYNHYDIDSTVVTDTYSKVTGALALEFPVHEDLLLHVSGTQLFKGPEIGEVFIGAGLNDTPNPDIEAEEGYNLEASVAWRNDLFNLGTTFFHTQVDNYIYDYAPNPATRYWKDNVGDMAIDGFEAYAGLSVAGFVTTLTYAHADSSLDAFEEYESLDGTRLDRTQGDTISINADYIIEAIDLTLHWDLLWVDDLEAGPDLDGASFDNAKDGYSVQNISARWEPQRFAEGLAVTFGIDNLFDEYYASQSSRTGVSLHPRFGELYLQDYEPGRNVKLTVAYQY